MLAMEDDENTKEEKASAPPKNPRSRLSERARRARREHDKQRGKTRVNLGRAHSAWRKLREKTGFKTDAEMAFFLINIYLRTKSDNEPERPKRRRSSSTETCERVHYEFPYMMSSSTETELETCAAPDVHTPEDGKELGGKDTACQKSKSQDKQMTNQSENEENGEKDEEFTTSLSVGDGRYLVDLGSSSEFIVDEESILQLFKTCRECNRKCLVRKHVKGLKLVVYQTCRFCQSHHTWTNLPDEEDDNFQINGKDAVHGQMSSATSPSSNTS